MQLWEGKVFCCVCLYVQGVPLYKALSPPSPDPLPETGPSPAPNMFKLIQLEPDCKGPPILCTWLNLFTM